MFLHFLRKTQSCAGPPFRRTPPQTPCLGDPSAGPSSARPPSGGPPKISVFFSPLPPQFSSSLGGRFVEFCWLLKTKTLKCARLALGLSCETPAALGPPGDNLRAEDVLFVLLFFMAVFHVCVVLLLLLSLLLSLLLPLVDAICAAVCTTCCCLCGFCCSCFSVVVAVFFSAASLFLLLV